MDEARIAEIVRLNLENSVLRAKCARIETETIERCAKVADRYYRHISTPTIAEFEEILATPTSQAIRLDTDGSITVSSEEIATAIRALKREPG